jgi:hypothetical protein
MSISCQTLIPQGYPYNNLSTSKNTAADLYSISNALGVIKTRQEIDIFILKYSFNVIWIHMKVFKLDKKLTSVFTNILTML